MPPRPASVSINNSPGGWTKEMGCQPVHSGHTQLGMHASGGGARHVCMGRMDGGRLHTHMQAQVDAWQDLPRNDARCGGP